MFTAQAIWGLDVGESGIKAVKLQKHSEGFSVLESEYVKFDPELKAKEGDLVVRDALAELESRVSFKGTEACVSISSRHVNPRFISMPGDLSDKEFKTEIVEEAEKQIPFPLKEVEWGYCKLPDRNDEMQLALFAARNKHVYELLELFPESIKVRGIQVPGLALYNLISRVAPVQDPALLIDFGERNTNLIIMYEGGFWLRSLPVSGGQITELLQKKFRITEKEAIKLKHDLAKSKQKEKLFRVIEPKLKDMVREVRRSISYFKTQIGNTVPNVLMCFGGSSRLFGMEAYLSKELQCKRMKNFELGDFQFSKSAEEARDDIGFYGVAIGLAMQGLDECEVPLNLYPKSEFKQHFLKSKRPLAVALNVAFFLVAVMQYIAGSSLAGKLEESKQGVTKRLQELQSQISTYQTEVKSMNPDIEYCNYVVELMSGGDYAPLLYKEVLDILQELPGIYLTNFQIPLFQPEHYKVALQEENEKTQPNTPAALAEARKNRFEILLNYSGKDSQQNYQFYNRLIQHPLFKVGENEQKPLPKGEKKTMSWTYEMGVEIKPEEDLLMQNRAKLSITDFEKAMKVREQKGWLFDTKVKEEKEYSWSLEELRLPVNLEELAMKPGQDGEGNP